MAIAALALRLATVFALRDRTPAGARVSDSAISPLDERVVGNRQPALVVYTDDVTATPEGRELIAGPRSLQLVIEVVVAEQVEAEGDDAVAVTVPQTDEGLELSINLIERSIVGVLSKDAGPWAKLWRELVLKIQKFESQRGAGAKDGVRFAARQIVLTLQPLEEPGFGEGPLGVWAQFLALIEAEATTAPLAPVLRAAIVGDDLPEWSRVQALFALTDEGAKGIGIAPAFDALPTEDGPPLAEIRIESDDGERVVAPEEA